MGQPRVSFCGPEMSVDLPRHMQGSSDSDDISESGKVNNAYVNEDMIHSADTREIRNGNGMELGNLNGEGLDRNNKVKMLNRRRVSITSAGDAVIVRGAHKSYKSGTPVLNGLNMTVPCGSMYVHE